MTVNSYDLSLNQYDTELIHHNSHVHYKGLTELSDADFDEYLLLKKSNTR